MLPLEQDFHMVRQHGKHRVTVRGLDRLGKVFMAFSAGKGKQLLARLPHARLRSWCQRNRGSCGVHRHSRAGSVATARQTWSKSLARHLLGNSERSPWMAGDRGERPIGCCASCCQRCAAEEADEPSSPRGWCSPFAFSWTVAAAAAAASNAITGRALLTLHLHSVRYNVVLMLCFAVAPHGRCWSDSSCNLGCPRSPR